MKNETEKLVKKYLADIKDNLPDWITNDKEKLEDILLEIESHVWDSANEIAGSDDPDITSVQKAINRIGSSKEIAKSYKARGTPKYFISEELWQTYRKVIFGLISVIFVLISIVQIVVVEPNNLIQALINIITLSVNSITIFIIIITVIFVYLSSEGYFPEDLDSKTKGNTEKEKFENKYFKPGEYLFNGIMGIIFGLFLIILPKDMINLFRIILNFIIELINIGQANYSDFTLVPELRLWATAVGILAIITGITHLMKIQTRAYDFHILMNFVFIFTRIGDILLVVYLASNLHFLTEILPLSETILLLIFVLGFIGSLGEIGSTIRKNMRLYEYYGEKTSNYC